MLEQAVCRERLLPAGSLRCVQRANSIPEQFDVSRKVALICHDLRLPLTAILANAEFLTQSNISEMERAGFYQGNPLVHRPNERVGLFTVGALQGS